MGVEFISEEKLCIFFPGIERWGNFGNKETGKAMKELLPFPENHIPTDKQADEREDGQGKPNVGTGKTRASTAVRSAIQRMA